MDKLPMCRMCLVEDVRMYIVAGKNLHGLYEKLTDMPFVTEDRRPMLACFFCLARLKQCYRFLRNCLKAEELFAQILNEDYEPNPIINRDQLVIFGGFVKTTTENISIVDVGQCESIAIKEELPAVCEGLHDNIELKEEHQSDEEEPENLDNSCLGVADIPPERSELDLEDYGPLMKFKPEVEEVSKKKRRARETTDTPVVKKSKLDTRRTKLADIIRAEQKQIEPSGSQVIPNSRNCTSKRGTTFKKPSTDTITEVRNSIDNTAVHTNSSSNSNKDDLRRKISKEKGVDGGNINSDRRSCIKENLHQCEVCPRNFRYKSHLTCHSRVHTGETPYQCDICPRSFSYKGSLTIHIRTHTGQKPYKCEICLRSFICNSVLAKHLLVHTGEKPFKCDICDSSFTGKYKLTKHKLIHSGDYPYKCKVCQRSFRLNSRLTIHMRTHTGEKLKTCDICQRSFNRIDHFKKHIQIHKHKTNEKHCKCGAYKRSFMSNSELTKHILTHTCEKKFQCDVCQHRFWNKRNLISHIRIHTGEKPYKCEICQRSFGRIDHLKNHIIIHTGKKPFKCDICVCSFNNKSDLMNHIRKHTEEEKPFKCEICLISFSDSRGLKVHLRVHK